MREDACLALGFFDSVHIGHRVIIAELKEKAEQKGASPFISTFLDSFAKKTDGKLVYTFDERKNILSSLDIHNILAFDFDEHFKNQSANSFLGFLEQKFNLRHIVCGYDYRFGRGCEGDVDTLTEFTKKLKIGISVIDKVCLKDERVSTTLIKEQLEKGDIKKTNMLLGNEYFISGKVIKGRGDGKLNSIPTANISICDYKLTPKSGVYATMVTALGKQYSSVTSIGTKPTYDDYSFGVETHIDGLDADLYGTTIQISFFDRLRDILKFDSKEQLREQIEIDKRRSKEALC